MMKREGATPAASDFPPALSRPALQALEAAKIQNLAQVHAMSDRELLALHGMGPKGVRTLRQAIQEQYPTTPLKG